MNKTRLSLYYLGSYLAIIGFGLLLAPDGTLKILQSNGTYGDVFPRIAGMLMSGLGITVLASSARACLNSIPPRFLFACTFSFASSSST